MEALTIIEKILALVVTLTVGGVLGSLISLKWKPKIEKAKAEKEEALADAEDINNARSLIDLYKQALDDLRKLNEKNEAKYIEKLNELEKELDEYKNKFDSIVNKLKEKDQIIEKLMKSQLSFKMELQRLTSMQDGKCSSCMFKDGCDKYKALKETSFVSEEPDLNK